MKPPRYHIQIDCECGNQMEVEMDWLLWPADQMFECSDCGRQYVLSARVSHVAIPIPPRGGDDQQ